mmetsp:Transcript_2392/g.7129  ORF Transcript_2392/g.7129 Transcript_2392/m.7129 type:complete len:274 (-) Transcript_2392:446-1267(-)
MACASRSGFGCDPVSASSSVCCEAGAASGTCGAPSAVEPSPLSPSPDGPSPNGPSPSASQPGAATGVTPTKPAPESSLCSASSRLSTPMSAVASMTGRNASVMTPPAAAAAAHAAYTRPSVVLPAEPAVVKALPRRVHRATSKLTLSTPCNMRRRLSRARLTTSAASCIETYVNPASHRITSTALAIVEKRGTVQNAQQHSAPPGGHEPSGGGALAAAAASTHSSRAAEPLQGPYAKECTKTSGRLLLMGPSMGLSPRSYSAMAHCATHTGSE